MGRAVFFSSLFTKAKYGITLGIVLYFVEEIVMLNLIPNPLTASTMTHILGSISPSYMMERAEYTMIALEITGRGLTFSTLSEEF